MTTDRWNEVKRVFHGALDLPPEQRTGYIATACNGDHALRQEVQSLLGEHQRAEALISPIRNANLIGQTVSHYRIVERLGRGGMGVVYKAEDAVLGRAVALKFVAPEISHSPQARARLLREAQAAAAVTHPNLCTLLEIGEHQGQMFLVMNFVEGRTLRERMESGALAVGEALRIAAETASGLHALHSRGIIHRDIKSSNIMLESGGRAVITDFGIASVEGQDRITRTGGELGTVAYMAPELLAGARPGSGPGPRSDLWSLGVVLFEALTGQMPFHADNQAALAALIQNAPHTPLTSLRPEVSVEIESLVNRLLAKDPAQRFQQAVEVEQELCRLYACCTPLQTVNTSSCADVPGSDSSKQTVRVIQWSRAFTFAKMVKYAMGAALLVGLAGALRDRHDEAPTSEQANAMSVAPETSYPGMEESAVFSPDGRQIAFSWENPETGQSSVCVKMSGDDNKVCLGSDTRAAILPAWSPDGRWIAYLRRVSATTHDVVLSSPLGGQERVLTQLFSPNTLMHLSRMAWMPDSKALLISDQDPSSAQNKLWKLSIETRERTQLTDPPEGLAGDRSPAVSRDGQWLAFVREKHLTGEIAVVPVEEAGTGVKPLILTAQNRFIMDLTWTPDAGEIIFSAAEAMTKSDFRLWRIEFHGHDYNGTDLPRRIEAAPTGSYSPSISPEGGKLLYTSFRNDQNIWRLDRDTIHSPWKPARKFTEISSTREDAFPSFSPDGGRISFVSSRSGTFDLWVSNVAGGNPRQLTTLGGISGTNAWSPDGRQIAFDWITNGNWDAYLINAEGGAPRRLTSLEQNESSATWSRDGRYLYINSDQSGRLEVWRQRVASSLGDDSTEHPPEQITRHGGMFAFESADGKSLIFTRHHLGGGPIYQLFFGQEKERVLVESVMPLCFFVTARGIYYFAENPDRTHRDSLRYYDFSTAKSEFIFASPTPVSSSLTVSPDERTVLFTQRDEAGSDIMRIESFR